MSNISFISWIVCLVVIITFMIKEYYYKPQLMKIKFFTIESILYKKTMYEVFQQFIKGLIVAHKEIPAPQEEIDAIIENLQETYNSIDKLQKNLDIIKNEIMKLK